MKQSITKFGVYALLTGAFVFLAGLYFGQSLDHGVQAIVGYGVIILSLLFVYAGIKNYRDNHNQGKVSFGQALKIGFFISLFAAVGIAIVDYIFTAFINPDFFEEYAAAMRAEGKEVQEGMTSTIGAVFMLVVVTIVGLIVTTISALILQRK